MTSPDGVTWTNRTAAEANSWRSVTYGNGLFVAVAFGGTNRVMTSPDGVTWTNRTAAEANFWRSVTYGNGLFVAVGSVGGGADPVMTSSDGVTWIAASAAANSWKSVTYGNGQFVAVSSDNGVMTSPDGTIWTARTSEISYWDSVTYGNGLFVAVAYTGTNQVMTSPDGVTWTSRTAAGTNWGSVTYGNGLFVAVGSGGRVMTSGKSEMNVIPTIDRRAYGQFYRVGNQGAINNANNWTQIDFTANNSLKNIAFDVGTDAGKITVNYSGVYKIQYFIGAKLPSDVGSGQISGRLVKNGNGATGTELEGSASQSSPMPATTHGEINREVIISLAAGDYIKLAVGGNYDNLWVTVDGQGPAPDNRVVASLTIEKIGEI
jgi:hypothetical protein